MIHKNVVKLFVLSLLTVSILAGVSMAVASTYRDVRESRALGKRAPARIKAVPPTTAPRHRVTAARWR